MAFVSTLITIFIGEECEIKYCNDFTFLASKGVFVDAVQPSIEMTKKSPKKHAQKRSAELEQTEQQQEKITRMDAHLRTGKDYGLG